jgi:hypothetical protein
MKKTGWWSENWKPLVVVWLICLLPFLPVLFSGQILFSSDQAAAPAWRYYFDTLRSGGIPLWNPYALSGMPAFDAMFGDGSYPPFVIMGFLLPVTHIVTYNFVLHVLIAGFCAFVLARNYFRLTGWLAAALAVAYALNPHYISYIFGGHTGKFHIMSWLPLSLYFALRTLGPGAHWRHLLGLSLTIALFVLTTHLQFTYFVIMGFTLVWVYFLATALRARKFGEAGSLTVRFWIPLFLGVGLAFFIFYPPMQYTKNFGIRGSAEKSTYEHAVSWSLHPEETASLLVPEFGGINEYYWGRNPFKLNTEAPGVLVWFLGLFGLFAFLRNRGGWYWLWGTVGGLAILYGLAAHTPVFRLFYEFVPGVKNFRAASMMLFWLGIALLAMSGETLRRLLAVGEGSLPDAARARMQRKLQIAGYSVAGVLVLFGLVPGAVFSVWNTFTDLSQIPNFARQDMDASAFGLGALRVAALTAVLTWAAVAYLLKSRRAVSFGLVALAVTVVDHYWVDSHFIQPNQPGRGFASEPAVDHMKADKSRFRVFDLPGVWEKGYAQFHGLESTGGWTDNEMRHYRAYRGGDYTRDPNFLSGLRQNPDGSVSGNPFLDLLNVKYLAFRVQNDPGLKLVLNTSVLPRAFFVPAWEAVTDSQALQRLKEPGFDPRRMAFVTAEGVVSGGTLPDSGAPLVAAIEEVHGNNRFVYRVNAPARGVLFASELWFPHWKVKVDGKPVPLLRTNFAFRGAFVEAGAHSVEFEYHSSWLRLGFQVGAASLVALVLFLWAFWFYTKRTARAARPGA